MKLFLTTTSLFEQINSNSADYIALPDYLPLKQGLSDVSVDPESAELLRHLQPAIRKFRS
jgi:hypothetical protein